MQLGRCEESPVRDLRHENGSGSASSGVARNSPGTPSSPEGRTRMTGMDVEWGPEAAWGSGPRLDEFLLARIAEDERLAAEGTLAAPPALPDGHPSPFDPDRVRAECAAKRRLVLACRELRPDTGILGARRAGMGDFPLAPHDQHQ